MANYPRPDPNFHVSSSRDHAKESMKAHTTMDRLVCTAWDSLIARTMTQDCLSLSAQRYVPKFRTMFSSLRHYPRQTITLDTTDPVPQHVPRQWKGYRDQARETIIRYKK